MSEQLIAEKDNNDWRPGCGLRLGPHFCNSDVEIDRFMDRVDELAKR